MNQDDLHIPLQGPFSLLSHQPHTPYQISRMQLGMGMASVKNACWFLGVVVLNSEEDAGNDGSQCESGPEQS